MQLLVEGIIINYKGIQALNHDPYGSNIGGNDPIAILSYYRYCNTGVLRDGRV
jgi:hypothetical protein